jgi:hypothetical protein
MPIDKNLRFWGVGLPSNFLGTDDPATRTRKRQELRDGYAVIKQHGLKAPRYGFKNKGLAVAYANKVKAATGVELEVFQHDYL